MYRAIIAALCLIAIAGIRRNGFPTSLRTLLLLLLVSILGQIVPFVSLGMTGHLTTSQDAAIMMGAAPLITFLMGRFVLPDEAWSWSKGIALTIGFAGLIVALAGRTSGASAMDQAFANDFQGRLFALLAAAGYAGGAICSRLASRETSSLTVCAVTMTVLAICLAVYGVFSDSIRVVAGRVEWFAILFLGVVNTAMAYVVYFWLIKFAGASFASLNNYIVPVIGLIFGYIFLSEQVDINTVIGLLLIVLAVYLFRARSVS